MCYDVPGREAMWRTGIMTTADAARKGLGYRYRVVAANPGYRIGCDVGS